MSEIPDRDSTARLGPDSGKLDRDPSRFSRTNSISPANGTTLQDGWNSARLSPGNGNTLQSGWNSARSSPGEVAIEEHPVMPTLVPQDGDEEEVEQGRPAHTRKTPVGMTPIEMSNHALTHIPFHPGCRSCVAGRKRDHQHPRRSGLDEMQRELDAANAHVSADYSFRKIIQDTRV